MSDYKSLYLKYKVKYLRLKNDLEGGRGRKHYKNSHLMDRPKRHSSPRRGPSPRRDQGPRRSPGIRMNQGPSPRRDSSPRRDPSPRMGRVDPSPRRDQGPSPRRDQGPRRSPGIRMNQGPSPRMGRVEPSPGISARSDSSNLDIRWKDLCRDYRMNDRECKKLKKIVKREGTSILRQYGVNNLDRYIKGRSPSPNRGYTSRMEPSPRRGPSPRREPSPRRGPSPRDRRGPSPRDRRGPSPRDRRGPSPRKQTNIFDMFR
jgi:hypothetical protein